MGTVSLNVSLKEHTTFKIGGEAEIFVVPNNLMELIHVLTILKENNIPYFLLGAGSNLLISDCGIKGAVIKLGDGFDYAYAKDDYILAGARVSLAKLASCAKDAELSGLEFASGIPGSLGGALFMNAGAYGGEVKNVISEITYLTPDLELKTMPVEEAKLSYRHSVFKENGCIVVSAKFKMEKAPQEQIKADMNDFLSRRKDKQPLEYPSAGSTFKRPEGYFAGALIEQCGFKGKSLGGAQISDKHAGFLINKNNATAKEILDLIELTQETVKKETGITLEPEVIILR